MRVEVHDIKNYEVVDVYDEWSGELPLPGDILELSEPYRVTSRIWVFDSWPPVIHIRVLDVFDEPPPPFWSRVRSRIRVQFAKLKRWRRKCLPL